MGWFSDLKEYRDDRHALIQAHHQREAIAKRWREERPANKRSDEYQKFLSDIAFEDEGVQAEIAEIETRQMLRRAARWRVPIPLRPYKEDEGNEWWDLHRMHGTYYLTDRGLSHLRREAYQEWEMWTKPWLSIIAVAISMASFGLALTAFLSA